MEQKHVEAPTGDEEATAGSSMRTNFTSEHSGAIWHERFRPLFLAIEYRLEDKSIIGDQRGCFQPFYL